MAGTSSDSMGPSRLVGGVEVGVGAGAEAGVGVEAGEAGAGAQAGAGTEQVLGACGQGHDPDQGTVRSTGLRCCF
jgi:hypothetical protein